MAIPQRHKTNTTEFLMPDNVIAVIASDEKPIKCVREGDPTVLLKDPTVNMDFTHEFHYAERYGLGVVTSANSGIGKYIIA